MRLSRTLILVCLLISANMYSQTPTPPDSIETDSVIFGKVDVEASFTGGDQAWRKFLEKNLNPNVPVDNGAPAGLYNVVVQFVVNKEGRVSEIKPLTKQGYGMEQEVIRLMQKSVLWSSAQLDGRPVNAYRKQPVIFMVQEDGFAIETALPYVLFAGTDNELTISVRNVKNKDLDATISDGTIIRTTDGKFLARVPKRGRVLIKVFNTRKNNKEVGSMHFDVVEKQKRN